MSGYGEVLEVKRLNHTGEGRKSTHSAFESVPGDSKKTLTPPRPGRRGLIRVGNTMQPHEAPSRTLLARGWARSEMKDRDLLYPVPQGTILWGKPMAFIMSLPP